MSLLSITLEFEMKTHSERSLLAASTEAHVILTLANLWLGALNSGFLIQAAEVMEWGSRLRSSLIWYRWFGSVGSKLPLQGTKHIMTLYGHGCSMAEGHMWEVMIGWVLFLIQKLLAASGKLNSSKVMFLSVKHSAWMSMLWLVFWGGILGGVGSERLGALGKCCVLVLCLYLP